MHGEDVHSLDPPSVKELNDITTSDMSDTLTIGRKCKSHMTTVYFDHAKGQEEKSL